VRHLDAVIGSAAALVRSALSTHGIDLREDEDSRRAGG
jgi:hypothetical protein